MMTKLKIEPPQEIPMSLMTKPWLKSFLGWSQSKPDSQPEHRCSPTLSSNITVRFYSNGVLINDRWILTSASGLTIDGTIKPCANNTLEEAYVNPQVLLTIYTLLIFSSHLKYSNLIIKIKNIRLIANEATITLGALNVEDDSTTHFLAQRLVLATTTARRKILIT